MTITVDELCDLLNSKIQITTTNNKSYEGVLKLVLPENNRVTFEQVYELPSRKYLGRMHTQFSNVLSWKRLEQAEQCFDVSNFNKSPELLDDVLQKIETIEMLDQMKVDRESSFIDRLPSYDYCIIDSISPEFFRAVEHLTECSSLGASFHGPDISRSGELTWICISSQNCSFLFDIQNLSDAGFERGLRKIFESNEIEKIIHDCREPSDCLLHMFHTELRNVFDTQAADYLINLQMYAEKDSLRNVSALDSCLFKYLEIPKELLLNRNKSTSLHEEKEFFRKRPVSKDFIRVLLNSSIYLLPLKEKEEELLMFPFKQAVLLSLDSLRNAPDSEVQLKTSTEISAFAPNCLLKTLMPVKIAELPLPPDDFVNQFKSTVHGRKAWRQWKMIQNTDSDSD